VPSQHSMVSKPSRIRKASPPKVLAVNSHADRDKEHLVLQQFASYNWLKQVFHLDHMRADPVTCLTDVITPH
jgi:hypothetical protein